MEKPNFLMLLTTAITLIVSTEASYASQGRGGGDPLALEFKATAATALKNMQSLKGEPFSHVNISLLQSKISSAQILVSDQPLTVTKDGVTQTSAAENLPGQNLIIISRSGYRGITSASVQQALALHEFLSLSGVESTGNYPVSGQYLIAESGVNFTNATAAIASATKVVAAYAPCSEPNSVVSTLFSMIAAPTTTVAAVQAYLQKNLVAWDSLNNQCETVFDASVDQNRLDIFQALFSQYSPNLSAPQGTVVSRSLDSIYGYVLEHGTTDFLDSLKLDASTRQQQLSLTSVYGAGVTDLMVAANAPNFPMVQYLIQGGSSVSAVDSLGISVLIHALEANSPDLQVVAALINAGENVNVASSDGTTPLIAASTASFEIVQSLIQAGAKANMATSSGLTSLMNGSHNPDVRVIQALIQAGANVNARDSNGSTALIQAASYNSNIQIIKALIQAGANVNAANSVSDGVLIPAGSTALIAAAASNANDQVIQELVKANANVNAKDSAGDTALIAAATSNLNVAVIQALIQAGADVNAANTLGEEALMRAANNSSNVMIAQTLIQSGASVNATNNSGDTALIYAALPFQYQPYGVYGNYQPFQSQVIQLLIQAGADLTVRDNSLRETALDYARSNGAPQSLIQLLGGNSN